MPSSASAEKVFLLHTAACGASSSSSGAVRPSFCGTCSVKATGMPRPTAAVTANSQRRRIRKPCFTAAMNFGCMSRQRSSVSSGTEKGGADIGEGLVLRKVSSPVPLARLHLEKTFFGQEVGREISTEDATGVDADGPLELVDLRPRSVAIHDERRTAPQVRPGWRLWFVSALRWTTFAIDDLDSR